VVNVKRGELYWADLGDKIGSKPSFDRPVLVVQANIINRSKFQTVVVVGVTSSLGYSDIPGNVFISKEDGYLPKDSVICVAHMTAVDKSRFGERISSVSDLVMDQVEYGISLVLDLK
jgi:mRNA interferase MazF